MQSRSHFLLRSCILFAYLSPQLGCDGIEEEIVPLDEIITLTILNAAENDTITEAQADGDNFVVLIAEIPQNADAGITAVNFTASEGGEAFNRLNDSNGMSTVNSNGVARATYELPLSDVNKKILFKASVTATNMGNGGNETFFTESTLMLLGVQNIISLTLLDENSEPLDTPVVADGATFVSLEASVNFNQDELNEVVFSSTGGGTFQSATSTTTRSLNSQNKATIAVQVPKTVGRLFFNARVGGAEGFFAETDLDLQRALPDEIILEPAASSVMLGSSISLNVFTLRSSGTVSEGTPIGFEAFQLSTLGDSLTVGRFTGLPQALTNSDGEVSGVSFFTDTDDIDTALPVIIRAFSQNNQNESVESSVQINITQ